MIQETGGGATIGGAANARIISLIESDTWNVANFGIDGTGLSDATSQTNLLADRAARAGNKPVIFPTGTYRFDNKAYFGGNSLVEFNSGTQFVGAANASFNVLSDITPVSQGQSTKTFARLSVVPTNSYTAFFSQVVATTMAVAPGYEKAPIYSKILSYDNSGYEYHDAYDEAVTALERFPFTLVHSQRQ